jgi:hypothetical protein
MEQRKRVENIRSSLEKLTPNKGWREVFDLLYRETMQAVNRIEWLEFRHEGRELPKANNNHPEHVPEPVVQNNWVPAVDWSRIPAEEEPQQPAFDPHAVAPTPAGPEPMRPEHLPDIDFEDMTEEEQETFDEWNARWITWRTRRDARLEWEAGHREWERRAERAGLGGVGNLTVGIAQTPNPAARADRTLEMVLRNPPRPFGRR